MQLWFTCHIGHKLYHHEGERIEKYMLLNIKFWCLCKMRSEGSGAPVDTLRVWLHTLILLGWGWTNSWAAERSYKFFLKFLFLGVYSRQTYPPEDIEGATKDKRTANRETTGDAALTASVIPRQYRLRGWHLFNCRRTLDRRNK